MASIGAYEAVHEIQSSAEGSVWEGVGSGDVPVTIVVLGPFEDSLARVPTEGDIRSFLDGVSIQKTVSEDPASCWVRVLDFGRTARGAFAVFAQHRRSVQQLIEVRATVDSSDLAALIRDALRALRALQDKSTRSHGGISASKVFLKGSNLSEGVLLSMPEPGEASVANDLHAIGRLVYRLVTRREFEPLGGWPIEPTPEWNSLGGGGKSIRALCERFLDPDLPKTRPSLENVEKESAKVGGGSRRAPVLALVALLVVVAAGAIGFVALRSGGGPGGDPTQAFETETWRRLCWTVDLLKQAGLWQGGREPASQDPFLADLASKAGRHTWFTSLDSPTPGTYREWQSPDSTAASVAKRKHAGEVSPMADDLAGLVAGLKDWPIAEEVRRSAPAFAAQGWARAGEEARLALEAFEREWEMARLVADGTTRDPTTGRVLAPQLREPIAELRLARDRTLAAIAHAETIDAAIRAAEGDALLEPVASRLRELATAVAGAPLKDLAGRLEPAAAFAGRLSTFARGDWKEVDREAMPRQDLSRAGVGELDGWIVTARNYLPVTSDAPELGLRTAALEGVRTQSDRIRAAIDELDKMGETSACEILRRDLARLSERAAALEGLRGVASNLARIGQESAAIEADSRTLSARAESEFRERSQARAIQLWNDMRDVLNAHRTRAPASGDAAINERWTLLLDETIGTDAELPALSGNMTRGREVNANLRDRFGELAELAARFPREPSLPEGTPAWLVDAVGRARDLRLASAVGALRVVDGLGEWDEAARDRAAQGYEEFIAGAREIAEVLSHAGTLLAYGYGPDDRPEGATLTEHAARARTLARGLGDTEVTRLVEEAVAPADRLAAIASSPREELARLASAPGDAPTGALVTTWRALGNVSPTWPASREELLAEGRLTTTLRARLTSTPRGDWMEAERSSGLRRRLDGYISNPARTTDELAEAGRAASDLEVTLSWGASFDVGWARLRTDAARTSDGLEALALAEAFRTSMGEPPADLGAERADRVRALYAGIVDARRILVEAGNARPLDPATVGPGTAAEGGWTGELLGDGERLRYQRSFGGRVETIEFRLISEGVETPVFVATTEATIGLFAGVLGAEPLAAWSWRGEDPRDPNDDENPAVPVGWSIEGGRVSPSRAWVRPMLPPNAGDPLYAPEFRGPTPAAIGGGQREPTWDTPMQYLRPSESLLLARRLGCRFPSEKEWTAALRAEVGAQSIESFVQARRSNLSDETYRKQLEFIAGEVRGGKIQYQTCSPSSGSIAGTNREGKPDAWATLPGYDDGVLWFRPAPGRGEGAIVDLIGNVAEFVCERAEEAESLRAQPAEVERFLRERRVGLIGGSAVMDTPDLGFGVRPIARVEESITSDAGLRLVFSAASALGPAQRAPRVLRDAMRAFGDRL